MKAQTDGRDLNTDIPFFTS